MTEIQPAVKQVMKEKIERYMDVLIADRTREGLDNPVFKNHGGEITALDDSPTTPGDVYAVVELDEYSEIAPKRYFSGEGANVDFSEGKFDAKNQVIEYGLWIRNTPSNRDFALQIRIPIP